MTLHYPENHVDLGELLSVFTRIGLLSFGGPAGQIALMHSILVEERKWLEEKQFLHALNFCMLLPGPEAMQLATYAGWLIGGIRGGLAAGCLFVLPGFTVLVALSAIYAFYGDVPAIAGLLFGLKAAVLAIVVQALGRLSRRTTREWSSVATAIAAFTALAFFRMPFPAVIFLAAAAGLAWPRLFVAAGADAGDSAVGVDRPLRHVAAVLLAAILFWVFPVVALLALFGPSHVFAQEAVFFSKAAFVTFGGAYAVLGYVGQLAVESYQWLQADEMLTGLGLAETTPGPLILVLVFVGFLGAVRRATEFDALTAGLIGAVITTWVTFVPCFIWIFLGAPFIEALRGWHRLSAAFSAITAAVVGVIANLSLWFALHVFFGEVDSVEFGPVRLWRPDVGTVDLAAVAIALGAAVLVWRGLGLFAILGACALAGLALRWTAAL
jgi:chromate transporter